MIHALFVRRVKAEWKEKWKVIRSIVDWTVAFYFIVPALIFVGMYYHSMWDVLPNWTSFLSLDSLLFILFLFFIDGEIRTYVEEADLLLFREDSFILKGIIKRGILLTSFKNSILLGLIVFFLLPILINQFNFTLINCLFFFFYCLVWKIFFSIHNRLIHLHFYKWWKKYLCKMLTYSIFFILFGYGFRTKFSVVSVIVILFVSILIMLLVKTLFKYNRYFLRDIYLEQNQEGKWTKYVLEKSGNSTKRMLATRPWLLRKSQKIFKRDQMVFRIIESFIKIYFRDQSSFWFYIQFSIGCSVAFLFSPTVIKIVILLFAPFLIYQQSKGDWHSFNNGLIMRVYFNEGTNRLISKYARFVIAIPFLILLSSMFVVYVISKLFS
ncbi:ABC transporter permease [Bacillus sp. RG28]|uniref:ABC transporter permease n=1 Tax=Gottfriedia endophytica TaxID=2820819 RepID=A0A940NQU6_9BACI|nr:ABC transporter permease [Gottfriedia endophytica]MBP0726599.1 ABC transporter permease [Gottfriedia endophytica]